MSQAYASSALQEEHNTAADELRGAHLERVGAWLGVVVNAQLVGRRPSVYQEGPLAASDSGESGHSHPRFPPAGASASARNLAWPASRMAAFGPKRLSGAGPLSRE